MEITSAFVKDAISLYEPFSLYSEQLGRLVYRHSVRLSTTLFDGKNRRIFCSVFGGSSYRGTCCEWEIVKGDRYMSLPQLLELQHKLERIREKNNTTITHFRDTETCSELKMNEDIYVERTLKRRKELLNLCQTQKTETKEQQLLFKQLSGYKIEKNAFFDNNYDIFQMCVSDKYHL